MSFCSHSLQQQLELCLEIGRFCKSYCHGFEDCRGTARVTWVAIIVKYLETILIHSKITE